MSVGVTDRTTDDGLLADTHVVRAHIQRPSARRTCRWAPRQGRGRAGAIINEKQVERAERMVDDSVSQGANVVTGGKHEGPFFEPTVLGDVTTSMPAFTDEIFGPVAPVIRFKDDAEAVELANATDYGLVAAVQSGSQRRAAAVAEQLRAGMVHVNDSTINEVPPAPFGGFGCSSNAATSAAWRASSCEPSGSG
jgi:benzaldehyde dehydrogenase (NAD)